MNNVLIKNLYLLGLGIVVSLIDMSTPKSLSINILKRLLGICCGLFAIISIDVSYLYFDVKSLIISLVIGLVFAFIHLTISKGIILKKSDINAGLIKTCFLIYFLELPSEEFIYRGILLLPLIISTNSLIAIILSSLIFLLLHLKTWNSKFVWFGSLLLGIVCATSVILTHSIWTAIIIHNLNDFAFITLVNKTNIFNTAA